jgi:hypothetical protein
MMDAFGGRLRGGELLQHIDRILEFALLKKRLCRREGWWSLCAQRST